MTLFHFIRTSYNFQANLVLIKMGLYWPNFSLVFLIHFVLYAGVYLTGSLFLFVWGQGRAGQGSGGGGVN